MTNMEDLHKAVARTAGQMSLAIVRRRVSASRLLEWSRQLEYVAHHLKTMEKERAEKRT